MAVRNAQKRDVFEEEVKTRVSAGRSYDLTDRRGRMEPEGPCGEVHKAERGERERPTTRTLLCRWSCS
jgi:hypothetical protein